MDLKPNPKQMEFFRSRARFIAYGGARGGGKSWAIRQKAKLLGLYYGGIRILILRRTFPELRENHILPLKKELAGLAQWREVDKAFAFGNGSRILFGHCAGEHDVDQYQGQEYDIIFIDEATQFTEYQFFVLTACLRGANRFPKRMYLTCNPGGVGHMWVKRLFIDRAFRCEEDPEDYEFIQAKATDNPALVENDPGYLKMLDKLPQGLREAWRDGRWDVFAGQYFPEFRSETHVVEMGKLPGHWPRYRVFDYGLDMLACFWAAIDESGRIWVYREYCQSGLIVSEAARVIKELTPQSEKIRCTIAPPDLWSTQKDTGRTMAELFARNGVPLVKAANQRVQGWMTMKEFLKAGSGAPAKGLTFRGERTSNEAANRDLLANSVGGEVCEEKLPGLVVSPDCKRLIRDISAVQHDERDPADVATQPHEYTHTVDAIRYLCFFRAVAADAPQTVCEEDGDGVGYEAFMTGDRVSESYLGFG